MTGDFQILCLSPTPWRLMRATAWVKMMASRFQPRPGGVPRGTGLSSVPAPRERLSPAAAHFLAAPSSRCWFSLTLFPRPGISTVHSASPAAASPNNHVEAAPSHHLHPARPHALPRGRGATELGGILAPGYLGCGGQWDVMRPQKGSVSGDVSSGSSVCQLHSKPTGKSRSRAGQPGR